MATLNDVISCYNELVDEVNGHTASIDKLNRRIDLTTEDVSALSTAMASLTDKLSQLEARLDELVQEHDVMMDTISSLLAAPAQKATEKEETSTVELKRVGKKTTTVEEETPAPALKRVEKKAAPTVIEEEAPKVEEETVPEEAPTPEPAPTAVEETPAPTVVAPTPEPAPAPTVVAALKRASASAPKPKTTAVTEIQKRAFARQYMVEHGAKVEDLRNPEKINETIASEEFTAWMNER